jgi:hypothetical protein
VGQSNPTQEKSNPIQPNPTFENKKYLVNRNRLWSMEADTTRHFQPLNWDAAHFASRKKPLAGLPAHVKCGLLICRALGSQRLGALR